MSNRVAQSELIAMDMKRNDPQKSNIPITSEYDFQNENLK